MKKKIYTFIIMGALIMTTAFTGCGAGKADTSENGTNEQKEAIANPWVDTTAEEIMSKIGIELNVPEGAENVVYRMDESEKMEEMRFVLDESEYTARAQVADNTELTDISGYYYEWKNEEDTEVSGLPARIQQAADGDTQIEVINWIDVVPGINYSLSTTGSDLDGLDIAVIAEQVYKAMQGDN